MMARFSLDLHEIKAASALQALSQVPETQFSTDTVMQEVSSVDSEVTFRKVLRYGEVLSTRPDVDPLK